MRSGGYTLIEFLVVIGILAISIGSILMLLTSVIKSSNQTGITAEVKQNGQVVLDDLESQIRFAKDVNALVFGQLLGANSGLILTLPDGNYVSIICFNAVGTTSNGWIGIAKTLSPTPPSVSSGYQSLTNNRSTLSGIDINCDIDPSATVAQAFQVNSGTSSVKIVTVNFIVNQGVTAPSRADFLANAQFKTTISLRKYN